ncbi:MAG: TolC family protein [Oligoflexia bacterium]|nr:TolC family protein [Oligoflexia bacterium]
MRNLILLIILLTTAQHSNAATLSWQHAVDLALKQNPSLEASKKSVSASEANIKKSYGEFLPTVSVSAKRAKNKSESSSTPGVTTKTTSDSISATATLNVFKGFYDIATLAKSKISKDKAKYAQKVESSDIRLKLRQAFVNAYIQQEKIRLSQKVLDRQIRNEKLISIKYNSGTEARWNVRKSQSETKLAQFNLASAKEEFMQAIDTVSSIIGDQSISIQSITAPSLIDPKSLNNYAKESQENHPSIRKTELTVLEAEKDKTIARSAFYPNVDLNYSKSREDSKPETTRRSRTEGSAFSITASWNIFNGFTDYYDTQKTNLAYEAQELTFRDTKNTIQNEIEKYKTLYENAYAKIPLSREVREAAEERLKTVSAQYRSGIKNFIEWEQAESQLAQAEQTEINSIRDAQINLAQYEYALGKTLEE